MAAPVARKHVASPASALQPPSEKTAGIAAFLKNHFYLIWGFVLLSCIILQYTWHGRKGGQLYKHNSVICYPERIYYPESQILKPPYIVFLKHFLKTAEKHFMIGHRVNYYIFTDQVEAIPKVKLRKRRQLIPLKVQSYSRWQDVSMMRMDMIRNFSEHQFIHEVDYLVCVDVDMTFNHHVGVEILSERFGTLHPGFFTTERDSFTYERRPDSQAYIPKGEGDFYYAGGFFGGTVAEVCKLTAKCYHSIMLDKEKNLEAIWHDESHLNKYFLYHKPTKILSPEYLFDNGLTEAYIPKIKRFLAVKKNHIKIRNKRSATLE